MTLPPLSTQINVMVGLALASHFVFARFEPRLPESCLVYILVCIAYTCVQATSYHASLPDSIKTVLILSTTYNIVLGSSVATYRAFFHRASKFKGPLALTVSKLAWILTERAGKRPDKLDRLHDEYGDVVRIGPREISIRDPNALPAIYGVNLLPKGPWYNAIEPNCSPRSMSLLSAVDVAERKARRRVWDNAFSLKAIQSYHAFVDQSISATMVKLEALADAKSSVDVDMWTSLCTFDIAGQIGFSKSFGAVHKGAYPEPIQVMHQVTSLTSLIGCISWIAHLLVYLPSPIARFDAWTKSALIERIKLGTEPYDLFSHLLAKDNGSGWEHTLAELRADSNLVVIAGSDTSAHSIIMTLFLLCRHENVLSRLREELDSVFGSHVDDIDGHSMLSKHCPWLNACLNESMRLYPVLSSGLQRENPSPLLVPLRDGHKILVPANTLLSVPIRALHHDPRNFSHPLAFRPERWINPDKEEAFDRTAFLAFSYGPASCIGRNLAYLEMRSFVANFVRKFDFDFDPSFDTDAFVDGLKDSYTTIRARPLLLRLRQRG